jgi:uncharacterized protein YdiU (UPF0061 family)
MAAGFVHGVLNTDNINITGESFDYGPWRFLPHLDPGFTAAYFDQTGLYAFGRQPDALLWNLYRLAECLLPVAPQESLERALGVFEPALHDAFADAVRRRLGLTGPERQQALLAKAFWTFLAETRAPFEQAFFDWHGGLASRERAARSPSAAHYAGPAFAPVLSALEGFEPEDHARLDDPYFAGTGPTTTLLIDEVEALWAPIAAQDDWSALNRKLAAIDGMARAYRTGLQH